MIKFLTKRVIGMTIILATIVFFVDGRRIELPLGLLTGSIVSLYKIKLTSVALKALLVEQCSGIKPTLLIIALQLFMFLVLLTAILLNLRFFVGVFIGMLTLMFFICINSLTEKLGMTHNDWGDL